MMEKASKTSHLKDKFATRYFPRPEIDVSDTKQAKEVVHDWSLSEYHSIGTCAIGDAVGSDLRVFGARNLRVVDASVFPSHVSGNIVGKSAGLHRHHTSYELDADFVFESYGLCGCRESGRYHQGRLALRVIEGEVMFGGRSWRGLRCCSR